MVYGNPSIGELPTLSEVVRMVRSAVEVMPVVHRSDLSPVLNDEDVCILTRTDRMYSLKPNITTQGAIFGWQCRYTYSNPVVPSMFVDGLPDFMVENVRREDAEIIYESHPLYSLLRKGIEIPGLRRNIQIYNPYGISHAYGLPTPFISLSQSLNIAAYHACHAHDNMTGVTTPINSGAGLLMVFQLMMPFSMTPGLSTLGRQAFVRPGVNRLFLFQCGANSDFLMHPAVVAFQFRHTPEDTRYYTKSFSGIDSLYLRDTISVKLANLRSSNTYSIEALDRNLRHNPKDNRVHNVERLRRAGLRQVRNNIYRFTPDELQKEWFVNPEERWHDFWSETYFPAHLNLSEIQLNYLFELPVNPRYQEYFNLSRWFDNHPVN